jgi:hypothetical protein
MKVPSWIGMLMMLNLAGLAGLAVWLYPRPGSEFAANRTAQELVARQPHALASADLNFNWRQVESTDYRDYVRNLRSIGCPEETIRDIVAADVAKLFRQRKNAIINPEPWKYWQPVEPEGSRMRRARQEDLQKLESERSELLVALLGPMAMENSITKEADGGPERLDFLPSEKRAEVLRVEAWFKEQRRAIYSEADEYRTEPDLKRLKELRGRHEDELAHLLPDGMLFEYQLRNDDAAERLRRGLVGFALTEAEFREIFRLQKAHEGAYSLVDSSDANAAALENADQQETDARIKTYLGENRYRELRRGNDARFRDLYLLTQQFDLPTETAATLYDRHLEMQKEITRIQRDPTLPPDRRDDAVRNYQEQMSALIQQSLGQEAYARFQGRGIETFLGN